MCAQVAAATYTKWSFIAGMSYSWSGNMGFPLPDNWAFNQIQGVGLGSGSGAINIDKDVWRPGADPAVTSVNDASSTVDDLVAHIGQLYDLAARYGGPQPPNQLVMQYLRHETHRDDQWKDLLGPLDTGFIAAVADAGIQPIQQVRDPGSDLDLHIGRIAAACNGAYLHHPQAPAAADQGDLAGWGADWLTFYGQWRRDITNNPSGLAYCQQQLATAATTGAFTLRELIEAADGHTIAATTLAGATITDAVTAHYQGGGRLTRFTQFFTNRFGTTDAAASTAKSLLLPTDDTAVDSARRWHVHTTGGLSTTMPENLNSAELDAFCQGFANVLQDKANQETAAAGQRRATAGRAQ